MSRLTGLMRGRALDASLGLAIALLAGRLSGLFRELQLAASLGVSAPADIAVLLLTLPDLLVGLLLTGGLSAALVPQFRRLDEAAAATLFRRAALFATLGFSVAALVLVLKPQGVFAVLAPGVERPTAAMTGATLIWVALALPLTAASGVVTAFLNARDRYFVAGLGTLLFNLAVIASLAGGGTPATILTNLGLGIAVGAMVRLVTQAAVLPTPAWRARAANGRPDRATVRAFVAGVGAAGLALLAPVLVRAAASLLDSGTVAAFNYAQKLTELPVGILITTISTVALTVFSAFVAAGDEAGLARAIERRLRRSILTALIVMMFGLALTDPVVRFLLGRGVMDATALDRISALTRVLLTGIPCVALSSIATAVLNARLQTRKVLALTGIAVGLLPLMVLPGILLNSDLGLMGAVVAFQALLGVLLARAAGLSAIGFGGVSGRRFLIVMAGTLVIAAGCAVIATRAVLPDWAMLATGGVGFGLAMIGVVWESHEAAD